MWETKTGAGIAAYACILLLIFVSHYIRNVFTFFSRCLTRLVPTRLVNAGLSLENLVEVNNILDVSLDYLIKGIEADTTPLPVYNRLNPHQKQAAQEIINIIQKL